MSAVGLSMVALSLDAEELVFPKLMLWSWESDRARPTLSAGIRDLAMDRVHPGNTQLSLTAGNRAWRCN